jgi:ribosome-associated protein
LKLNHAQSLELARLCCRALDAKKAEDLRVIDVSALSSITNFLVIATATSEPHVRALRVELEKALDSSKTQIVGVETASESGWTVMDAFDVMVHIFTAETRSRYRLEHLWRDGNEVLVGELLEALGRPGVPKATPRKAKAVKKVPRKKKTGR